MSASSYQFFVLSGKIFLDLNKIRRDANEALSQLCWQTVFDQCQQTMDLFLMKTTERFGRMRNALSKVCNQARPDSLPQQCKFIDIFLNSCCLFHT